MGRRSTLHKIRSDFPYFSQTSIDLDSDIDGDTSAASSSLGNFHFFTLQRLAASIQLWSRHVRAHDQLFRLSMCLRQVTSLTSKPLGYVRLLIAISHALILPEEPTLGTRSNFTA